MLAMVDATLGEGFNLGRLKCAYLGGTEVQGASRLRQLGEEIAGQLGETTAVTRHQADEG